MREIKGQLGTLYVEGEADRWAVVFRDGGPAIFTHGRAALFATEADAVHWAYWTLTEPERLADDEFGDHEEG